MLYFSEKIEEFTLAYIAVRISKHKVRMYMSWNLS